MPDKTAHCLTVNFGTGHHRSNDEVCQRVRELLVSGGLYGVMVNPVPGDSVEYSSGHRAGFIDALSFAGVPPVERKELIEKWEKVV